MAVPSARWWMSGPHETRDRFGRFLELDLGLRPAGLGRLEHAVAHVLVEQTERDRLESLCHRRDLGEDVDAVLLLLDHALQAAGLALDAPQTLEVVVLAVDVPVLVLVRARGLGDLNDGNYTPLWFMRYSRVPPAAGA